MHPVALTIIESGDLLGAAAIALVVMLWAIRTMFHLARATTRAVLARVRADESFDS